MAYALIKNIHLTAAALSYALFFLRGLWMIRDSALLGRRWVRVLPHVNDTVLLAAGAAMAFVLRLNPGTQPWLSAKLAALVAYVLIGLLALRPGRPKRARVAAWLAAQAVFFYIVAVALTRDPLPF